MNQLINARLYIGTSKKNIRNESLRYVIGFRKGIAVIDMMKTMFLLKRVFHVLLDIFSKKKRILLISSEAMHDRMLRTFSYSCGNQYYVSGNWVGGALTNFRMIRKVIKPFEKARSLPSLVLPIGRFVDSFVVREAMMLGIPAVCFVDTATTINDKLDYIVPLNTDSESSIRFVCLLVEQAYLWSKYNLMREISVRRNTKRSLSSARNRRGRRKGKVKNPVKKFFK